MFTLDETLIELARTLGPLLHDQAAAAEQTRRLSKSVFDALAEAGFQRMFTPKSLGGLEVDPVTCARVIEEVARFDSAAGWALQAGNSGAWWSARLPDEGAEEIYRDNPSALMAAAFHPPQQARQVAGGYRVTGRSPMASNIHDAQWLMVTAFVTDGTGPRVGEDGPEIVALVLRADDAEVIDTWHTLGMRGTDSNDVELNDVFVPGSRAYRLVPAFEPGAHFRGPLYRFPGIGEIAVIGAPVLLAIAHGSLTELRELASRKTPFGSTRMLRDRTLVQAELARAEALWRAARLLFYDTLSRTWERAVDGKPSTLEQKADLLLAGAHAASTSAKVTSMMQALAGTTAIYARNRLERHFRDAQTLRHHGFISESRFETVGQVYLGVAPEFRLVAF